MHNCTYVYLHPNLHWLYLYQHITSSLEEHFTGYLADGRGGKHQIFCGRPEWEACLQLLLSCWSQLAWLQRRGLPCLLRLFVLSCVTHYLDSCAIIFPNVLLSSPKQRKAKWEPSVRCYKLLARPVARPREPDLAAPRLRRVKRYTQRSSLHLYAPYIGRLLLQPTGTWLLAS